MTAILVRDLCAHDGKRCWRRSQRGLGTAIAIVLIVVVVAAAVAGTLLMTGIVKVGGSGGAGHAPTYNISFTETGLPSATSWSVNLSGDNQTATGSVIWFLETNGSYPFTITGPSGCTAWVPSPASGSVDVAGSGKHLDVSFTGSCTPSYELGMSAPTQSTPASGIYWSVITISPQSGLTTGLFGLALETPTGAPVTMGAASTTTCKATASFTSANCGAPSTGTWYVVLCYISNNTVANVYSSSVWTGGVIPVTSTQTLVVVSGSSLAGSEDTLNAVSTGSAEVSGQSGPF